MADTPGANGGNPTSAPPAGPSTSGANNLASRSLRAQRFEGFLLLLSRWSSALRDSFLFSNQFSGNQASAPSLGDDCHYRVRDNRRALLLDFRSFHVRAPFICFR
eukprot:6284709-Pyramimonas_sp.AAC.1